MNHEEHHRRIAAARDKIQQARLLSYARWLVNFGHLRKDWPNPNP